ncbi:MAG: hypothetical protein ACPG4U_10140 [Pseudomonadales bacterium]
MHTADYLDTLNLEQLVIARDHANQLIKQMQPQTKISLLIVQDVYGNAACFHEQDFEKAKEKLVEVINNREFDCRFVNGSDHPRITKIQVHPSEVDEWMKLNEMNQQA